MRRLTCVLLLGLTALIAAPSALAAPKKIKTHTVYPGQTLGMIAKRYNVPIEALCGANGIKRKSPIQPKQRLVIPGPDDQDGSQTRALVQELAAEAKQQAERPAGTRTAKRDTKENKVAKAGRQAGKSAREDRAARGSSKVAKQTNTPEPGYSKKPKRRGHLSLSGPSGSWHGLAVDRKGRVQTRAEVGVAKVLASWRTGQREDIHRRLIRMLVRVSDHFGGRPIRVVSGYRPYRPDQYTPHSRHNEGRAVDFFIPGVPNEVIRDFCRTLPNVGVGYYPNSTFIHMDVREIRTYWIDYSGPGEAPRYANATGKDPGRASKPEKPSEPEPKAEEAETEATDSEPAKRDARQPSAQPDRG
ncbi:MAG: DUF882 domain-containing protein [Polyangiaceae bacterium]